MAQLAEVGAGWPPVTNLKTLSCSAGGVQVPPEPRGSGTETETSLSPTERGGWAGVRG